MNYWSRISVRNADRAYVRRNINDSILERSRIDMYVFRGNLVYLLETTYHPDYALMGQARGQTNFDVERETKRWLLETFDTMINSFALTESPVSFDTIARGTTYPWHTRITDLIR